MPSCLSSQRWFICLSQSGMGDFVTFGMGDFVTFVGAGNIPLEYAIDGATISRSWTSYFAIMCNRPSNAFCIQTNLDNNFNDLDPIVVAILFITGIAAIKSTKIASRINSIAFVIHVSFLVFVTDTSKYLDFMPYRVRGIFTSAVVLYFAYVGFDAVATMAEETKNPAKDIPVGLVGSMVVIITFYCLMALTLCLMQNYNTLDDEAGYNVAFSKVEMDWAKYIVALGALEGMTTVLMGVRLPISEWNWETLWHS